MGQELEPGNVGTGDGAQEIRKRGPREAQFKPGCLHFQDFMGSFP